MFTIGHSNRSIEDFIQLLQVHGVESLVDIRTIPKSRHNPQFNLDALKQSLQLVQIRHLYIKSLGGLRHAARNSVNLGWRNASFRGFADYMATPEFEQGLQELMRIAEDKPTTIMCAEAVPWRCHRSLVADALIKQGWVVRDIMNRTKAPRHRMTPFLKIRNGRLIYPEPQA
ncbi:MAG: DUF488 domain-containing protein [Gammaproteobacteria bacterium]|nr:DUF488 domain-containing protein [Gammaproteobacteria bacterium]